MNYLNALLRHVFPGRLKNRFFNFVLVRAKLRYSLFLYPTLYCQKAPFIRKLVIELIFNGFTIISLILSIRFAVFGRYV